MISKNTVDEKIYGDTGNLIDLILNAPGIEDQYKENKNDNWILFLGDKNIEEGLKELPFIEQEIIRLYFLENKSLIDISNDLGLSLKLLQGHLISMEVRLRKYV